MGYVPSTINGQAFAELVSDLQACMASKGTSYYNKISGGVKCSNLELSKLDLIIYLLNKYDNRASLDCIFSGQPMPGVIYGTTTTPTDTTTYLNVFVDHALRFCKDCIVSDPPAAVVPPAATYYLYAENGTTEITLESGGHINLQ